MRFEGIGNGIVIKIKKAILPPFSRMVLVLYQDKDYIKVTSINLTLRIYSQS